MEKLSRILAIVNDLAEGTVVLDKAVTLARRFGARVELLLCNTMHTYAFAESCTALGYDEVTLSSIHLGADPPHEVIFKHVLTSRPDLVVKAPAGKHHDDWWLANECPVPVLLVRPRPWADPLRFAAAVDIADQDAAALSRSILHAAGFLTLGCHGTLDILYSERERHDDALRMTRAVALAQLVRKFHVDCERIRIHTGEPEKTLPPVVALRQYDVLVLGAKMPAPSMKSRLVDAGEGDVVLVRAPSSIDAYDISRGLASASCRPL